MGLAKNVCCLLLIIVVSINRAMGINLMMSHSETQLYENKNLETIKTSYGGIYDCVDFYEQPAFKHPRLKYHKYNPKMKPNYLPNITTKNIVEVSNLHVLENGGCSPGKVPIKRLSKEDHFRATMFSKSRINDSDIKQVGPPGTHFAILQTKDYPNPPQYYGVGARMSIWNPQVKENQYSAGQLTIQNGFESLQVGWMVNPTINKDTETHMFIHRNAGESHCYNTYCPGFVVVRSDLPPDSVLRGYSKPGKPPMFNQFFIYRDTKSGDWWLLASRKLIPIGFWPGRIFNSLNKYGTYISCGGETYSPPDQTGGYPPMGSGKYPIDLAEEDALADFFETVNEKQQTIDVVEAEKFMDTKKYIVDDLGIIKEVGHVLYFGGYGG